jgi:hypothetical protein
MLGQLARQAQGKKCCNRSRTHSGKIAQSARKGAMSNGFRRMPVEPKMAPADRQIGCDSQFLAGASAQQGAVVSYSKAQARLGLEFNSVERPLAKLADESTLGRTGCLRADLIRTGWILSVESFVTHTTSIRQIARRFFAPDFVDPLWGCLLA